MHEQELQAEAYLAEGKLNKALEIYLELVDKQIENVRFLIALANIHLKMDDHARAIDRFAQAAQITWRRGYYSKAALLYRKVLQVRPNNLDARENLVRLHLIQSKEAEELAHRRKHERKALEECSEVADLQMEKGMEQNARNTLRKMMLLDPGHQEACRRLADLLVKDNRLHEAVAELVSMTRFLLDKRMISEARKLLAEAASIDPEATEVRLLNAELRVVQGRDQGMEDLNRIAQEKHHPKAFKALGRQEMSLNRLLEARDSFLHAFMINRSDVEPLIDVAQRLIEKGDSHAAFQALEPVADHYIESLQPKLAHNLMFMIHKGGLCHYPTWRKLFLINKKMGREKEATFFLEKLVNGLLQQDEIEEAMAHVRDLIQLDPENDSWWKLLKRLQKQVRDGHVPADPITEESLPEGLKELKSVTLPTMSPKKVLASLPSRNLFKDRLHQALKLARRHEKSVALLFLDLDRTTWVEHTGDHECAQELVAEAATRVMKSLRDTDSLVHLGGDEFAIIFQDVHCRKDVELATEKVREELGAPIDQGGRFIQISPNIGITLSPEDGTDPSLLLSNADLALRRARESHNDPYIFFTNNPKDTSTAQRSLERDLMSSVAKNELRLHYQPIMDLECGEPRMVGVEALVRWQHPELGFLLPGEFLDIARTTGFLPELGNWVLFRAVEQVHEWYKSGHAPPWLSVNITREQCSHPDFQDELQELLRNQPIPEGVLRLNLEGGEALMLDGTDENMALFEKFRRMGVSLVVDDFGTGYASISRLHRSPVEMVKIDASFVAKLPWDREAVSLVKAMINMAKSFEVAVVAEGVETTEQVSFLKEMGCRYAQGYFFSPPKPAEGLSEKLSRGSEPITEPG